MSCTLIVTVDTEEEGLWGGEFKRHGNTVQNLAGIDRFQKLCDEFAIKPTYLTDTPVVNDDTAVDLLGRLQDEDRCEIGAHLHPWCAPPMEEDVSERHTFMCNLSPDLQRRKLVELTEDIQRRFGRRPSSFRAGRYGLDVVGAGILQDLGYVVDSSVICYSDYSSEGGPDFRNVPTHPYRIGTDSLVRPSDEGKMLEVPISVGFNHRNFDSAQRFIQIAARQPFSSLRIVGVLDRLNMLRRIKFSPEQATASGMKVLVDAYVANSAPCVVMSLHSSSLVAGYTPYVPDEARLERFYADLAEIFRYCRADCAMDNETLTSFAESYSCPN